MRATCTLVAAAALALAGCDAGGTGTPRVKYAFPQDEQVAPAPFPDRQPGELAVVRGETVVGRTTPGGELFEVTVRTAGDNSYLHRRFGTRVLELSARPGAPPLRQFPCSSCHFPGGLRPDVNRVTDAHRNIEPVHPREAGTACISCHAPENVALLALGTGERVTLDHAYRTCAQCHVSVVDDWAAGAHGKRLDGWQGRRVVLGCADCHDPHRPAVGAREPFPPPRVRTGGRE